MKRFFKSGDVGQNDIDYVDIIAECIAGAGHPLNFSENVFNRNMILKLSNKSSIIGLGRTSITKEKYSIELIRRREVFHD